MRSGKQIRSTKPQTPAGGSRFRAFVRLGFGQCQIIGATVTLMLLLQTGVSNSTMWAAAVTGVVTLASILVFRFFWPE